MIVPLSLSCLRSVVCDRSVIKNEHIRNRIITVSKKFSEHIIEWYGSVMSKSVDAEGNHHDAGRRCGGWQAGKTPISLRYLTLTRLPSMIISLWHTLVIDIFLLQRSSGLS